MLSCNFLYTDYGKSSGKNKHKKTQWRYGMAGTVEVKDLSKVYGSVTAVDHVNLTVDRGALFGLLGPNGSGKTTMIKLLTGQILPTGGSAAVLGLDVVQNPIQVRERVGIIPEQETPPSFLTATEYLDFVGAVRNIPDISERSAWWFDFLDFADKENVLCKDLSRGTRQKLMFAQAFIHEPALALIDEPFINFDPIMQDVVKEYLVEYVKKGRTVFISTHILEVAEEICSEFAILHKGRLLHTGPVADIISRKEHLSGFFLSLVRKDRHA
jgi:ABC-2 type transport system ATP-binding protein